MAHAGAPFWPLVGLGMFLSRPRLWKEVVCPIIITTISTIVCLVVLFGAALHPQATALINAGCPDWIAWISAVLFVLAETAVVNIILMLILFGCVQVRIMRSILEEKGIIDQLRAECAARGQPLPEVQCYRDVGHAILFLLGRVPLMIITMPLHGIPVLGQIAWVLLNGWIYAWELQQEFLVFARELRGCGEQFGFVKQRCCTFGGFGAVAMALELIPFAGPWIFFASNACGAALMSEQFFKETHQQSGRAWSTKTGNVLGQSSEEETRTSATDDTSNCA